MARLMSGVALLIVQAAGCAVLERRGSAGEDARRGVESFLKAAIARENDRAFAWIEIEAMVNYGQPQWPLYRSLSLPHQEQYRRDFIGGIYAFLFRDQPSEQAHFLFGVPDLAQPVVEITGRPGKGLRFTLRSTPEGYRIVRIEKMEGATR